MEQYQEELVIIEVLDVGVVYMLVLKIYVGMFIQIFCYFVGWCDKIQGFIIFINQVRFNCNLILIRKEFVGVCGIIIFWNYFLMMLFWKIVVCLVVGNIVVIKFVQVILFIVLKFVELILKVGIFKGVVNVFLGFGFLIGQRFLDYFDVRKIGFIGFIEVGKYIMKSCVISNVKKVFLELGGKLFFIIFVDCDFNKVVQMGMSFVFFNKGENCIVVGWLFVEDFIYDEFVQRVVQEVWKMKVGNLLDRDIDYGLQNYYVYLMKLMEYCQCGVKEGVILVCGGN